MFILLVVASCSGRSQPLYSGLLRPVPTIAQTLDREEIGRVIQRAAVRRGWLVEPMGDNKVRITLNVRKHQAIADITYSSKTFKTTYVKSTNLNYDGKSIHTNYNRWVKNLEMDIEKELQVSGINPR